VSYKVYARHGGAAAAAQDDITDRVPAFDDNTPLIQMGMSCQTGSASQGSFIVPDPVGNQDASLYFPPHTQITWTEDASGDELWLARGRISSWSIGRPDYKPPAASVEWNVTVDDANVDLRGLAFTEDWVRPAETGVARLVALQAYTLNGASSTRPTSGGVISYRPSTTITISTSHLCPDSETVVMPAKTYQADTQPLDVISDCAETEGKVFGVVLHHVAGVSHDCLLYIKETDHSTYASACKISDVLADWDPDDLTAPVFEPIYDQGDAQRVDGNANISGIVSRYGPDDKAIVLLDATAGDNNEYWVEGVQDGRSVDPTQAAARAASIIAYRTPYAETDSVSIVALAEQIHLIVAGMSLQVKAAPINTANTSTIGTYVDRRIIILQWEPLPDGRYHGILQLNRPNRVPGGGALQPVSTSPKPAPQCLPTDPGGIGDPVTISASLCDVAEYDPYTCGGSDMGPACTYGGAGATSDPAAIVPGSYWGQIDMGIAYGWYTTRWFKVVVSDSTAVLSPITSTLWSGIFGHGCGPAYPWETKGGTFTVPAGYDRVQFKIGGGETHISTGSNTVFEWTEPADPVEQDPYCVDYDAAGIPHASPYYKPSDAVQYEITGLSDQIGDLHTQVISWKAPVRVATTVAGTLVSSFENGDTIDGVVLATDDRILIKDQAAGATNGIYTVNASGAPTRAIDLDSVGEATGATIFVSEGTANGNTIFVCTTNEPIVLDTTALVFAELVSGVTDHGALTGLADDDHSAYVTVIGGGGETVQAHGAMGATETVDLTNGNSHAGTLDADCTFTFSGATNGVECGFELELLEDGTGGWEPTWPGSVVWPGGTAPTHDTTADSVTIYVFRSRDGGAIWYGFQAGGGGSAIEVLDEGGSLTATLASLDFVGEGVTASVVGDAVTVTIPSGGIGPILISDTPSTPLIFADLIQNEAQDDLVYADV
jgi:hypothetical protein